MNSHRVHPIPCHVLSIGHSRARRDYPLLLALPTQLGHRPTTYPFPPGVLTQSIKSQKACTCSDPPPKKREAGGGVRGGLAWKAPPGRNSRRSRPGSEREGGKDLSLSLCSQAPPLTRAVRPLSYMSNWAGVVARVNPTKTGRCSRGTSGLWALGFRQRACTAQRHNIHVAPGGGFGVLHITRGYAAAVQQQCKPTSELQGVHCGPAAGRDWQVSYCG